MIMWKVVGIFLLFLSAANATNENDNPDWKAFIDQFGNLASSSVDGLVMARKLSEDVGAFLKSGATLGDLLAASLVLGPNSSEQKAVNNIQLALRSGFDQTNINIRHAANEINLYTHLNDFNRDIIEPIGRFQLELGFMTDQTKNKTAEDIVDFVNNFCTMRELGPLDLLNIIRIRLEQCLDLSEASKNVMDSLSVKWKVVLRQIALKNVHDSRHRHLLSKEFNECTNGVFEKLSLMSATDSNTALLRVETFLLNSTVEYDKMSHACNFINTILDQFEQTPSTSGCLLEKLLQAKQYKHSPLHQFSSMVTSAAIDLLTFGSFCSNISYAKSPDKMIWYRESLESETKRITKVLLEWIPTNLNRSWASFESQIVRDIVELDPRPVIQPSHFMALNRRIIANLTHYGIKELKKQVATTFSYVPSRFLSTCPADHCFTVFDAKKTHIFVSRFNGTEYRKLMLAREWIWKNKEDIKKSIERHRLAPLTDFDVFYHRESDQHFLQKDLYRNMIILRDTGDIYCDTSDYRIYGFHDENIEGFFDLRMYKDERPGCTEVRLLFFV